MLLWPFRLDSGAEGILRVATQDEKDKNLWHCSLDTARILEDLMVVGEGDNVLQVVEVAEDLNQDMDLVNLDNFVLKLKVLIIILVTVLYNYLPYQVDALQADNHLVDYSVQAGYLQHQ